VTQTGLCELSVSEAAVRIAKGETSSEELVLDCLARIEAREEQVQAWAFLDREHALKQARASDEERKEGRGVGALHGVPVGIKDIIDTADMPTENGCAAYKGRQPVADAVCVTALRRAGAIIMGKTVTTEFATRPPGKTRNPHDPAHTPGGSSSGSAAAVAAHMVPLTLGSQTTGSTIRPACYCGVYGFKPTHGLVPRTGILQLSRTLDHVGLFARSVEDLALLAEVLAGDDEGDPDTRPRARAPFREIAAEAPPLEPMFAFIRTPHWERADADAKEAFGELVEALGDRVEEVELFPSARELWDWQKTIMEAEMAANLEPLWRTGRDRLSERLRALIDRGCETRALDYQRALRGAPRVAASFDELFMERYDAILTLPALGTAPKGLAATGDPVFCVPWTLLGMPALSAPLMRGANGLPLGVQLVGRRGFDARLLRTARWLVEKVS